MSLVRWFAWWFATAFIVGAVIGIALVEPGGVRSSDAAEEFGRRYLAPGIIGAGLAVIATSPIAVIVAVTRSLIRRRASARVSPPPSRSAPVPGSPRSPR